MLGDWYQGAKKKLQDWEQPVQQAVSTGASKLGQMASNANNFVQDTASNIGNAGLNLADQAGSGIKDYFGNDQSFGGMAKNTVTSIPDSFSKWTNNVLDNKQNILPYANTEKDNNLAQTGTKKLYNFGAGIINNVAQEGIIKPVSDLATGITTAAMGKPVTRDTFKSGAFRVGADLASGDKTPQTVLSDIGQTAMPILNSWEGGKVAGALEQGAENIGLKVLAKESSKIGGRVGLLGGLAQGFQDNKDKSLGSDLLNTGISGAAGYLGGKAIGYATPYVGAEASKMVGDIKNLMNPSTILDKNKMFVNTGSLISSDGNYPKAVDPNYFQPKSLLFQGVQKLEGQPAGLSIKDVTGGRHISDLVSEQEAILAKREGIDSLVNMQNQATEKNIPDNAYYKFLKSINDNHSPANSFDANIAAKNERAKALINTQLENQKAGLPKAEPGFIAPETLQAPQPQNQPGLDMSAKQGIIDEVLGRKTPAPANDVPFKNDIFSAPTKNEQPGTFNAFQQKAFDKKGARLQSIGDLMGYPRELTIGGYSKKELEKMGMQQARDTAELLKLGYPKDVIERMYPGKFRKLIGDQTKFTPLSEKAPSTLQPQNKVDLNIVGETEKQKVQSAIVNAERIKNELNIRGKDAFVKGRSLSANDLKLAEQYESGIPVDQLAQKAENPQAFKTFMNSLTDYYDYRLAVDHATGGSTPMRENYIRHEWDLGNPQDLAGFNELAKQRGLQPFNGFSAQPRVFKTYAEGEATLNPFTGQPFKRANTNILGDLQHDYGASSTVLSRQALKMGLGEAAPNKVSVSGYGVTPEGKPFINSNIPGLEGMSFHPKVNQQLKGFQPNTSKDFIKMAQNEGAKVVGSPVNQSAQDMLKQAGATAKALYPSAKDAGFLGIAGTLYDHASQPMKHFLLNFSGFHSINVSTNFAGASLGHPIKGIKGLAQSIPAFFSETYTKHIEDGFKSKLIPDLNISVFDAGLRAGVNMDRGLPKPSLSDLTKFKTGTISDVFNRDVFDKGNIFNAQSKAIFDRELYTLKLNLVDQVFGAGKVDPASPKGIALGKEINMIMGDMNNHTMNINPNTQKWLSRVLLAPQFTESKYKLIGDSFRGNANGGGLALKATIGKSLVMGTLATFGTVLAKGQFPNLKQILLNYTVSPEVQTNMTNPKGQKLDVALPATFVSEPSKPIAGLLNGSTDELTHYGEARLAPALSDAISLYTNKDYYGNPIVDPNSDKSATSQIAKNIGIGDLPIGVQNVVNYQNGKQSGAQTATNIIGLRTKIAADDPTTQMWNDYKTQKDIQTIKDGMKFGKISEKNGVAQIEKLSGSSPDASAQSALQSGDIKKIANPKGDYYMYKTSAGYSFADSEKAAQKAIAKDKFANSDSNFQDNGDYVLRKSTDGSVTVQSKAAFTSQLYKSQLTNAKNNDDIKSWLSKAEDLYKVYDKMLNDPSLDDLEKTTIQNDAQTLYKEYGKYKNYGGFTKGSSTSGAKKTVAYYQNPNADPINLQIDLLKAFGRHPGKIAVNAMRKAPVATSRPIYKQTRKAGRVIRLTK